ncbi:SGNH/GDSL hydrolase family protein [Herbiconiux sp. L3-i23]|uniref:SGNH/GDSL hydrolase family protein n=1 Tax=Herbiconiux sp. L3-i23 TaxID=2905871 RepID=UPI002052772E|nr:SGNH/GDSL hydrolase family protein [Herbiconiux sp. L3-i23]BDI22830.1 hypothetical protein L3i23_16060 [Herbiconiux sp. L3-i23]
MRVAPKLTALLAGVALVLTACAAAPADGAPRSPAATADPTLSVAIVGDSLTAVLGKRFAEGEIDPSSWVPVFLESDVRFVGGWALAGATTADMRAAVAEQDADLLIVMAGTNDVLTDRPLDDTLADIDAIVDRVGAAQVLVSAIPPIDFMPGAAEAFNDALEETAEARSWTFADPFAALRVNGAYREGTTLDGIHPTAEAQVTVGKAVTRAVERLGLD